MHPLLNIAVRAARRAGEVIARSIPRLEGIEIHAKDRHDYVTEVDRAAEREIIAIVRHHYPEHAILAEESGASGTHETRWIIDPLDGTTNFLHGFPVYAVSIACEVRGRQSTLRDRKSTRLNSSHQIISYAVFCLKKKKTYAVI